MREKSFKNEFTEKISQKFHDQLVRTAAFQASRYKSEAGWGEFKSVAVRIWLLCK